MQYDFTSKIDRTNTGSNKWRLMFETDPNVDSDVLPLSVADMEFRSAPEIYEGLIAYLKEGPILGYTSATADYLDAVVSWQERRHNWEIEKDWIATTPGVVAAFNAAIRAFSEEEEGVIIFSPVYHPFSQSIENNNRKVVDIPLHEDKGYYTIDFKAFEEAAKKVENKMLLFCSPHNPVGRVWTEEELEKLANIAVENNLTVVSDEVWYDFVRADQKHIVLDTVHSELSDHLITCTSASKTFNLAGIASSNNIIRDEALRNKFIEEIDRSNYSNVNILGYEATKIAYREAEEWLDQVLEVIYSNQEMVKEFFEENYPDIKAPVSEGTYVQWVDFRALGLSDEELENFLNKNQFFTNQGYAFGNKGSGYARVNVALPREMLKKQLEHLLEGLLKREAEKE